MTVLLVEGFDTWAEGSESHAQKGWQGGWVFVRGGRCAPGYCAFVIPNNGIWKMLPSSYTTLIVGVAISVGVGGKKWGLKLANAGGWGLSLGWDDAMRVRILDRDWTEILGTQFITTYTWHYYELKITAGGTVEVKVDGVQEIAPTSGNWGPNFDRVVLDGDWPLPYDLFFDDLYIADTTGGTDFLGDVYVQTLYPTSDGTYSEWTPDSGTNHYARVDEQVSDDDLSYVKTNTVDARDTYQLQALPPMSQIYAAQLNLRVRKNCGDTREIKPLIRQDGVDYLGSLDAMPSSYDITSWMLPEDPAGGAWTAAHINNNEYGIKLIL